MSVYRWMNGVVKCRSVVDRYALPVLPLLSSGNAKCPAHSYVSRNEVLGINQIFPVCQYSSKRNVEKKYKKDSSSDSSSSSDSDSDKKKSKGKGRRGQTAFWRQKMRTHHMVIDLNNDGVVSWDDFEVLIKNFATLGNLQQNDLDKFSDAMRHVWEEEWGASGDPYAFISQEQFLANMEHVLNTEKSRKMLASPLPFFFKAIDWDDSGEISVEEFKTFYKCLHLPEDAAIASFATIDLNGDGRLSRKEFVRLGRDFFLSEDEGSQGRLFWGPLQQ